MPEFPFFFLEMASYSGFEVVLGRAYVGIHAFCEMKLGIDFTDGDAAEDSVSTEKQSKKGHAGKTAETDDILGSLEIDDSFTNYLSTL